MVDVFGCLLFTMLIAEVSIPLGSKLTSFPSSQLLLAILSKFHQELSQSDPQLKMN